MLITNFTTINSQQIGQNLTVGGFADTIRDHGGLIFIDLRSQTDILQCVIDPQRNPDIFKLAEQIHNEYVLKIKGKLVKRSDETINPDLPNGEVELEITELEIVSKAKTLPFDIHADEKNMAGEDIRLKYRYLDFRRSKIKTLMTKRHKFLLDVRNWFDKEDFVEVHTPILANSSPEGARDYLVPSRIHPGKFYALPQAPQQFKQLLVVGGFNKYMQIAPCFRDEDPRADRLVGDFYQIDSEIAWADEEDIYKISNRLINEVFAKHTDKKLMDEEMIRIDYFESMDKYGTDKPDLRYDLAWIDSKSVFKNSGFKVFADLCDKNEARVQALVIKNAVDKFSRSDLDKIQAIGRDYGLPGIAYIQYFEDGAKSPIFKFFADNEAEIEAKKQELEKFFEIETGDLVLFVANKNKNIVHKAQNEMRKHIAKKLDLIDDNLLRYVWIENFPFFEKDEKTGKIDFSHNPFSIWQGGLETLLKAKEEGEIALLNLKARQYDIAVNGFEVLSGGVRNPHPEALKEAFKIVGYKEEEIQNQFGHMMQAYEYGAPSHAGFAWGVPRNLMVLFGEENVREVVPFPKSGSGTDPMTNSPSTVSDRQLKELGIKLD
jgi:aspartyl-tRNA synthetase